MYNGCICCCARNGFYDDLEKAYKASALPNAVAQINGYSPEPCTAKHMQSQGMIDSPEARTAKGTMLQRASRTTLHRLSQAKHDTRVPKLKRNNKRHAGTTAPGLQAIPSLHVLTMSQRHSQVHLVDVTPKSWPGARAANPFQLRHELAYNNKPTSHG